MTSTFVNDLRLNEQATGDNSGSWGTVTNTNLELIAEAFSFGTEAITTDANTHETLIADGATDPGRSMFLRYTGTLDSPCTITISAGSSSTDFTISKLWFIENATTGGENIIITSGSGANVTIPAGDVKVIYTNGAGASGAVVDAFASLSVVDLKVQDDLTVTDDASVGGILGVTGVLTTTAAAVFNGGFAANSPSTISTANNSAQLTLISTDADANVGPNLTLFRNSANPDDNDAIGRINFQAQNDRSGGSTLNYAFIESFILDASDGAESAELTFKVATAGTSANRLKFNSTETVFNDSSLDLDFRVESDNSTHAFFVQGSNGNVGLGVTAPACALHIDALDNGAIVAIFDTDNSASKLIFRNTSTTSNNTQIGADANDFVVFTGGAERFRIAADGAISTPTAGTSNVRLGVNAGDAIASGTNYNTLIGDEAGTELNSGDYNVAVGFQAGASLNAGGVNTIVGALAGDAATDTEFMVAIGVSSQGANVSSNFNTSVGGNTMIGVVTAAEGYNTTVGFNGLRNLTTGSKNAVMGALAGDALTEATFNCVLGAEALTVDTKGSGSVAVGRAALELQNFTSFTTTQNVAVGNQAGLRNATGTENTFIGGFAGRFAGTSIGTTFVGTEAGLGNDSARLDGDDNTAVGRDAGHDLQGAATNNTMIGSFAGQSVTTHARNTMVGLNAGSATNSSDNTFIGTSAGSGITSGDANTIVGRYNGNQGGLDIRESSNNIVLSDGDGNPQLLINDAGDITNNVGNLDSNSNQNAGFNLRKGNTNVFSGSNLTPITANRIGNDGIIIDLRQADTREGNIAVSGSTVSYNGFSGTHESSGVPTDTVIGTIVSTIDELDTYVSGTKSGQTRADHAKIKVSDTEGDKRIYGVISGYTEDDNKPLVASVGIGSVKVTGACAGGDLLESNGDGTAKVQSDDIIRSKTIGKVTIANNNTGVKLVSCVLYCG